ncbi:MAG: inositol polyphosphate kinase family protein [Promethearchaeota archaeon]
MLIFKKKKWIAAGHSNNLQIFPSEKTICKKITHKELHYYMRLNYIHNPFAPKIYDIKKDMLFLQNAIYGYFRPCFMDVKIGTYTFEKESKFLKRFFLNIKDHITSSRRRGFYLCGYVKFNPQKGSYRKYGRLRALLQLPTDFLPKERVRKAEIMHAYHEIIKKIKIWMIQSCRDEIIGSSLLFIYEGIEDRLPNPKIFMIDFAHVKKDKFKAIKIPDPKYMAGIRSLEQIFSPLKEGEKPLQFRNIEIPAMHTEDDLLMTLN